MVDEPMQCERCGEPHAGNPRTSAPGCRGHVRQSRGGGPCGNDAMKGQAVCRMHGGKSQGAEKKAQQRIAQAEAERVLTRIWNPNATPVTDSVSALQRLAGALQQAVDVLGAQLAVGEACEHCGRGGVDLETVSAAAWIRAVRELRTALAEMERLGIAQRGMDLAEQYGGELAAVVRAILGRLQLSEAQQELVVVVVPEELRRVAIALPSAGSEAS